jgi:hypothetical protein
MKNIAPSHILLAGLIIIVLSVAVIMAQGRTYKAALEATPTPTVQATALPSPAEPAVSPTATPDKTAGWSVYRNDELGFEFEYPPAWGGIVSTLENGAAGKQFQAHASAKPLFFGGNSQDYASNGGGAQLYDFFEYSKGASNAFQIRFTPMEQPKYQQFTATRQLTPSSGIEAVIVAGQEYPQIFDASDRIAYVNLSGSVKSYKGIAFRFRDIPSVEVDNFDALISSLKLVQ